MDERPVVVRLEGRRSGNYALLSKTGPGTIKQLSDQQFLEWAEADGGAASARPDQQVVDLAEGEARLCEVMQAIQDEVVPQVSALIAARAQELNATEEGRETKPEPPADPPASRHWRRFSPWAGILDLFQPWPGSFRGC
ncbi:hypothetical protein ACFSHQ_02750 [Gemmobacter lanyuensis]